MALYRTEVRLLLSTVTDRGYKHWLSAVLNRDYALTRRFTVQRLGFYSALPQIEEISFDLTLSWIEVGLRNTQSRTEANLDSILSRKVAKL